MAIYPRDYEVKKFRSFQLTADALTSRDALEHFLYEQATSASCACTDLEVFDMEQWRTEVLQEYGGDVIGAALRKWFTYHILGGGRSAQTRRRRVWRRGWDSSQER